MAVIRESRPSELDVISTILAPAFEDKILAVIGNRNKALRIIPIIIRSIKGSIFVALDDSDMENIVGAIIISTTEFKLSLPIALSCLKVLGIIGSLKAFRLVRNYLKSEPKKLAEEGRLEAVGVSDDQRGKGIGKCIVNKGEEFLREQGMRFYGLGVKADNPAFHLYKKLGFDEITTYHNFLDDWIYMRKNLS